MEVELKKGVTIMTNAALHLPAAILNRAFSKRSGLPLAHFELYYGGTRLEGEATLSSYGVDIHSSVEVKMRGRGGMNGDGSRSGGKGRMKPAPQVDPASTMAGIDARRLATRFFVEANEGDTPTALRSMPLLGALLTLQNRQASFDWSFLQAAALGALALNGQPPADGGPSDWRAACNDNRLGPENHPLLIVLRLMADVVRPLLVEAVTDTSTPSLVAGRAALERRSTTQQDEAAQLCAWLLTQLPTESNPTESNPSTSSRQRRVIRPRTPAEPASSKLPKRKTAMKVSDNDAGDMALATVMEQLSAARDAAREVLNDVHGLLKTAIENGSSNLSHNDV